ncbi:MAG TPA: hypothetical protein VGI90_01610 [Steroidobacteraceae bacterium]
MRVKSYVLFSTRLGAALLSILGVVVAATAHADAAADFAAPLSASLLQTAQQCNEYGKASPTTLRLPTGTTFLLTEAGLIVLSQPPAQSGPEAAWPNTGN